MKNKQMILVILFLSMLFSPIMFSQTIKSNDLKLIWSDEFNTNGAPDSSKWNYDIGGDGWGNDEAEYYTNRPANVIVENGVLKIKTINENFEGKEYTSARLLTKGKFAFKYGKLEFRAKLPKGGGTWPALWMLGSNSEIAGWPECGEIDVMEHIGNELNKIFGTLHYPGRSGGNADGTTTMIKDATSKFHIYTLDWRSDSIKIYVDGKDFFSFVNTKNTPFNQDFYILMNCAIGGGLGGKIDPKFKECTFEIDYVRVYQ